MTINARNGWNPVGLFQKIKLPWSNVDLPYPSVADDTGAADPNMIAENFRLLQQRLEENHYYLDRVDWGYSPGTRWRTVVIAANDSSTAGKSGADFVCSGKGDETLINRVITLLEQQSQVTKLGRIVLLEGTYNLTGQITINNLTARSLWIEGMGAGLGIDNLGNTIVGTQLVLSNSGDNAIFMGGNSAAAGSSVCLENIGFSGSSSLALVESRDMAVVVRQCTIVASGTGGGIKQTNSTGNSGMTRVENNIINVTGTGDGVSLAGASKGSAMARVTGNYVTIANPGKGIRVANDGGNTPTYHVSDNYIRSNSSTNTFGIFYAGSGTQDGMISNNTIAGPIGTGITMSGYGTECTGNYINNCVIGMDGAPFDMSNVLITGNNIQGCSSIGIRVGTSGVVTSNHCAVIGNLINATTTGIVIGTSATNTTVFGNDTSGSGAGYTDAGTTTRFDNALLTTGQLIDATARVKVALSGAVTGTRREVNFIPGANITITEVDDNAGEKVDVTIATIGGVGSILTAKGSLIVATGPGVGGELLVGKAQALLTPDPSPAVGLKWGRRMFVQNTDPALSITPDLGDIWIDTT